MPPIWQKAKVSQLRTKQKFPFYHVVLKLECINRTNHQETIKGTNKYSLWNHCNLSAHLIATSWPLVSS